MAYIDEEEYRRYQEELENDAEISETDEEITEEVEEVAEVPVATPNKNKKDKKRKYTLIKIGIPLVLVGTITTTLIANGVNLSNYKRESLKTFKVPMKEIVNEDADTLNYLISQNNKEYQRFVKFNEALVLSKSLSGLPLEKKLSPYNYDPVMLDFDAMNISEGNKLYELYFEFKGQDEAKFIDVCRQLANYQYTIDNYANEYGMDIVTDMAEVILAAKVADTMGYDYNKMSNFELKDGLTGSKLAFEYNGVKYVSEVVDNEGKYMLRELMKNLEGQDYATTLNQVKYMSSDDTELKAKKK